MKLEGTVEDWRGIRSCFTVRGKNILGCIVKALDRDRRAIVLSLIIEGKIVKVPSECVGPFDLIGYILGEASVSEYDIYKEVWSFQVDKDSWERFDWLVGRNKCRYKVVLECGIFTFRGKIDYVKLFRCI